MARLYVLLPLSQSSPFSPLQPHQMLLSPLAPAGATCHLHPKSIRALPRPPLQPHGKAGTIPLTSCSMPDPDPDPEDGFPCRAEVKPGRSRRGGSVSHGRRAELLSFHRRSFIWIRVSSLLNPLFAVCYSTCAQCCVFIFISFNCFPVLMGSHYSHTIERKCIH